MSIDPRWDDECWFGPSITEREASQGETRDEERGGAKAAALKSL